MLGIAAIGTSLVLHPTPVPGMEWRTNIWLGPVLQFLILLHPRRRGWPLLAVVALPVWGAVIMVHHLDWRIQVLDLVFTLTPVATLGIGGACITNLLMELRLSQLRRIHDEQAGQRAQMREQERRVRIRLAHDSLLHTLQQISRDWDQPTREEAAGLAASAVSDLLASSQSFGDGGWTALHSLLEPALQDEGCDIEWHGRAVLAPSTVSDALVGATREAVRNVVKHAGGSAVITISRLGGGCRVSISDDGTGFDTTAPPAGRLGISEGIIQRMADVGGSATISSGAEGTTVTLEWSAEPYQRPAFFGPVARTLISWLPVPVLVASLVHVLVFEVGPSALGVAAIWLGSVAVSALGMHQLRVSGLKPWQPLVLTALAMAVIVGNYLWISPEGTNGYHVWTPSLVGAFMVLALPGRQLLHALALASSVIAVTFLGAGLALGWDVALGAQFGSIMAVVMYVLVPLALATGTSILARHARRTEELHAAKRLSMELAAERDATRKEWVTRMRHLAMPFLMQVADKTLDSTQEAVMARARILEARLRDELSLWPHGTVIADKVHALREDGWQCSVDAVVNSGDERQLLLTVMSHLPSPVPGQRLHLTLRHGDAVATITDPPFSVEQWHQLHEGLDVLRDEDFTQLRATMASPELEEAR